MILLCMVHKTEYTIAIYMSLNGFFLIESILKLLAYGNKALSILNVTDVFVTVVLTTTFTIDMFQDCQFYWTYSVVQIGGLRTLRLITVVKNVHSSMQVL
jgi:hypothetical protein